MSLIALTYFFFCTQLQVDYHLLGHFLCVNFLHCIALKFILPHFQGTKLSFFINYYVPEHAEQDQIDAKWLRKKLISQRKHQIVGRSLIIMNKSIFETENFIFSVQDWFYFIHEHETCIFTLGFRHLWKYYIWCSFGEMKFDLTLKRSNILYIVTAPEKVVSVSDNFRITFDVKNIPCASSLEMPCWSNYLLSFRHLSERRFLLVVLS